MYMVIKNNKMINVNYLIMLLMVHHKIIPSGNLMMYIKFHMIH